ncbi:hypothetical protein [Paludisphaera soli]|uniref:hypothetical protein n=1 Tax=Paludisphaera soli TaxID=2712865 RepID=UPI0013EB902B|nr:hypothetical protein [Paludisphaera soli]
MHPYHREKAGKLSAGIWLIGIGLLLASRSFWPGILFLAGATALIGAYFDPERRGSARAGIVLILLGLWSIMRFSVPFLLVAIGVGMILSAISAVAPARKPYVDQTLD